MLKKYFAICVDDDQAVLNQLAAQLEDHFQDFCEFEYAESGEEAVALYHELVDSGARVWLVVCDQIMPDTSGDSLLTKIHEHDNQVIKVLLTGQAGLESTIRAINHAGLNYYIEKPWNKESLLLALDKLKFQYEMTFILNEMNFHFASSINLDETLAIVFCNIINIIRAEGGAIFLVDEETQDLVCKTYQGLMDYSILGIRVPMGKGIVGHVAESREIDVTMDVNSDERHYRAVDEQSGFSTHSMVSVPLISNEEVMGVVQVVNKQGGNEFSAGDLNLLKSLSNGAAIAIQNVKFAQRLLHEERTRKELEIAQQIQRDILPKSFSGHPAIHFEAMNEPAKDVSGDFYDYFQVGEQEFAFVIGDVCGKGIPASIVMAGSRSFIKSQAVSNPLPSNVIPMASRLIAEDVQPGMFVTAFYGLYNITTHVLKFINAGHPLPLLFRSSQCSCSSLFNFNLPVGLFHNSEFTDAEIVLQEGDLLLLFTDGINEAINFEGEQFGVKRLVDIIHQCHKRSPKQLLDDIVEELSLFTQGQEQRDDITLLIAQF